MIARHHNSIFMFICMARKNIKSHHMTSIARNPTEMATKNIKKKNGNQKISKCRPKKRGEYKIFVGLIKIPCKFVYGDYCGRNPHHPLFTVMRACVCVCVLWQQLFRLCSQRMEENKWKPNEKLFHMRQTKQSSNNPTKKKGPVEPRTFSKAGHRWRAGDCMWLDTLEEMCAKNY